MTMGASWGGDTTTTTEADRVSSEIADKVAARVRGAAERPKRRASEFYAHAIEVFGDVAKDPKERALRFIEEAIELAQAAGIDRHTLDAVSDRVYGKEPGDVLTEIGQSMVTLELVALVNCVNLEVAADFQLERFKSKPAEHWRERQEKKKALGLTGDAPKIPQRVCAYHDGCPPDGPVCEKCEHLQK